MSIPVSKRWSTWTNFSGGIVAGILSIWPELASQSSSVGFILMAIASIINLIFQNTKQSPVLPEKENPQINQRGHHGQQKEKT